MSSLTARNLFSITFGDRNTWDDWKLIPVHRPVIAYPSVKTNIIDLTGADGEIDLMDIIVGGPVYANRTGSLLFRMVDKTGEMSVLKRKNEIAHYLHGIKMNMILGEEPEYYYTGKFEVESMAYKGKGDFADITIKYNIEPYKRSVYLTTDQWLWDTFSFDTGVIYDGLIVNAQANSIDDPLIIDNFDAIVGDLTVAPSVTISNNATNITFKRYQLTSESASTGAWDGTGYVYKTGTNVQPTSGTAVGLKFNRRTKKLKVEGFGKFTLSFRSGAV